MLSFVTLWSVLTFPADSPEIYWDSKRSVGDQRAAAEAAVALTREGLPRLESVLGFLADDSGWVRDDVVDTLVTVWSRNDVARLVTVLADRRPLVRENLSEVFARQKIETAAEPLGRIAMGRDGERTRAIAIWALGEIGGDDASKALRNVLTKEKKSQWLRAEALRALAKIDPGSSSIGEGLSDDSPAVRLAALSARLRGKSADAMAALPGLLGSKRDDRDPFDARFRLGMLEELARVAWLPEDRDVLGPVVDALLELGAGMTGRERRDLFRTLVALTGEGELDDDLELWGRWWKEHRGDFTPGAEKPGAGRTGVLEFHGLPVDSTRVLFLQDISGGMSRNAAGEYEGGGTTRLDAAKVELIRVIGELGEDAWASVVAFASRYSSATPGPVILKKGGRRKLLQYCRDLAVPKQPHSNRGNLFDPLVAAFEQPHVDTIYLVTEGAPTEGKYIRFDRFLRHLERWYPAHRVRVHVLAVGELKGKNRDFLERLAKLTGGELRQIPLPRSQ